MRPSDGPKLAALWASLCAARADHAELACVGGAKWRLPRTRVVPGLDALRGVRCGMLGWCVEGAPPLIPLRAVLAPGGLLAVLTAPPSGVLQKLWPWHAPESHDAALTTGLVLAGFVQPTRVRCADGAVVVHARLPDVPCLLDAAFDA